MSPSSDTAIRRGPLIPQGVQAHADDTVDQLWEGDIRLEGGLGEVLVLGENGIRIGFDEIDFVVRREAQIEPRVAVDGEQVVDAFAGLLDLAHEGGIDSFSKSVLQTPTPAVFLVPF